MVVRNISWLAPWFTCRINKVCLGGLSRELLSPCVLQPPCPWVFLSLYPVEPRLSSLLRTFIFIQEEGCKCSVVTLSLLLAIYGGSLDAAVWMPLGTWDTFSKASVSLHCLITDTLFTREEKGREGRHEDGRKPCLAALGNIIIIVIIGIAGT